MTALEQYIRLEAAGRWRDSADGAWREVLISFGNATLVLSDFDEAPLTHWSLAAIRLLAQDSDGARYRPDTDAAEELVIKDPQMIEAIAEVTARARTSMPRRLVPRRRRWWVVGLGTLLLMLAGLAAAFGPDFLRARALSLVPQARAGLLDEDIRETLAPQACTDQRGVAALEALANRVSPGRALVVTNWLQPAAMRLPGGALLVTRGGIENAASPEELAGWIALAISRDAGTSPLARWIGDMSLRELATFLSSARITSGDVEQMVDGMKDRPMGATADTVGEALAHMQAQNIPSAAFLSVARASFPGLGGLRAPADTGQVLLLDDQSWVAVQGVCN